MVFTSSASVVSRVGASSPSPFGFDALADGSIEPLPERLALDGRQRSPRFWPRPSPRGRTTEQAAALFWQFSASIKSLQRKQCIIKKWSTQAYQKAYQIRPSPLRRNGRCRLQAQSVLQPCPTGEVRGAECQRRRSRERSNPSHAQPAGRAWRGLRAPTL